MKHRVENWATRGRRESHDLSNEHLELMSRHPHLGALEQAATDLQILNTMRLCRSNVDKWATYRALTPLEIQHRDNVEERIRMIEPHFVEALTRCKQALEQSKQSR